MTEFYVNRVKNETSRIPKLLENPECSNSAFLTLFLRKPWVMKENEKMPTNCVLCPLNVKYERNPHPDHKTPPYTLPLLPVFQE